MGLLDEAIREHLELKRRSGADPGEIARKEHEALAPIFPEETSGSVEDSAALQGDADEAGTSDEHHDSLRDQSPPGASEGQDVQDFPHASQETAELDMQAVLDEQGERAHDLPASTEPAYPVGAGRQPEEYGEEPLEWEMQGNTDDEVASEEIPGQERLSFE